MNWLVISYYWTVLLNLGQLGPTTYANGSVFYPEFTQPISYPFANNIFVNETLFRIYTTYLSDVILPLLNITANIEWLPLTSTNRLQPATRTFQRSYSCQVRTLKTGWVFSVFSVDFTIMSSLYLVTRLLVELLWEKKHGKGRTLLDELTSRGREWWWDTGAKRFIGCETYRGELLMGKPCCWRMHIKLEEEGERLMIKSEHWRWLLYKP